MDEGDQRFTRNRRAATTPHPLPVLRSVGDRLLLRRSCHQAGQPPKLSISHTWWSWSLLSSCAARRSNCRPTSSQQRASTDARRVEHFIQIARQTAILYLRHHHAAIEVADHVGATDPELVDRRECMMRECSELSEDRAHHDVLREASTRSQRANTADHHFHPDAGREARWYRR